MAAVVSGLECRICAWMSFKPAFFCASVENVRRNIWKVTFAVFAALLAKVPMTVDVLDDRVLPFYEEHLFLVGDSRIVASASKFLSDGGYHRHISARHREFQRRAKSTNRIGPRSPGV